MIKHRAYNSSLEFIRSWLRALIAALVVVLFAGFLMSPTWAGEFGMASKLAEPSQSNQNPATNLQSEKKVATKPLGLLVDIRIHSAEELLEVLTRVDNLFAQGQIQAGIDQPIVFLLHGSEAKTLFKSAYNQYKQVVDLAARLSAFAVVDIKVCETWMGGNGLDKNNLQPFVGTVPYAVAEERHLLKQGYTYF